MRKRALLPVLALAALSVPALSVPAMAQQSGGIAVSNMQISPKTLARPMGFTFAPLLSAHDAQNGMTAADHQTADQNAISAVRGDPGFLSGFSFGTANAASRQPVQNGADGGYWYRRRHGQGQGTTIINNQGPLALTVGNGNVIQQQSANGSGPIALQQVATTPSGGAHSGALNLVTGSGNIVQRAPGGN